MQMGRKCRHHLGRNAAGGNREAGPGQDRHRNQQGIMLNAIFLDHAGLTGGFCRFGQGVVGKWRLLEQMIQRCIDGLLMARTEQLVQQRLHLLFPLTLFNAAGRLDDGLGEHGQTLTVGR